MEEKEKIIDFIKYDKTKEILSIDINKLLNASIRIPFALNENLRPLDKNNIEDFMSLSRQYDRYLLNIEEEIFEFNEKYLSFCQDTKFDFPIYKNKIGLDLLEEYIDVLLYCCTLYSIMLSRYEHNNFNPINSILNKYTDLNSFNDKIKEEKFNYIDFFKSKTPYNRVNSIVYLNLSNLKSINIPVMDLSVDRPPNEVKAVLSYVNNSLIDLRRTMFPQRKWHKNPSLKDMQNSFYLQHFLFNHSMNEIIPTLILALLNYIITELNRTSYIDFKEMKIIYSNYDMEKYKERLPEAVEVINNIIFNKNNFTLTHLNKNDYYMY